MKTQMITAFLQRYTQVNKVDEQINDFGIDYIFEQGICVRIGDEGYEYQGIDADIWLPLETVSQLRALLK